MPPQAGQPCGKTANGKTPAPSLEEPPFSSERKTKSLGNGLRSAPFPMGLLEIIASAHLSIRQLTDSGQGTVAVTGI